MICSAVIPCYIAFIRDTAFPSFVRGPELFLALRRFASIFFLEDMISCSSNESMEEVGRLGRRSCALAADRFDVHLEHLDTRRALFSASDEKWPLRWSEPRICIGPFRAAEQGWSQPC